MNFGCLSLPSNDGQRFLRTMVSGDYAIINSSVITFSHEFDALPLIQVFAVNYVAENGWVRGDQVFLNVAYLGTVAAGVGVAFDGSRVFITIGSAGIGETVAKGGGGSRLAFTSSKWRLRVRMIG